MQKLNTYLALVLVALAFFCGWMIASIYYYNLGGTPTISSMLVVEWALLPAILFVFVFVAGTSRDYFIDKYEGVDNVGWIRLFGAAQTGSICLIFFFNVDYYFIVHVSLVGCIVLFTLLRLGVVTARQPTPMLQWIGFCLGVVLLLLVIGFVVCAAVIPHAEQTTDIANQEYVFFYLAIGATMMDATIV